MLRTHGEAHVWTFIKKITLDSGKDFKWLK